MEYREIINEIKNECVNLRNEIASTSNAMKKRRLLKRYAILVSFLAFQSEKIYKCQCNEKLFYVSKKYIVEINQDNQCLIGVS